MKFNFSQYPTESLSILLDEIKRELKKRKQKESAKKRSQFINRLNPLSYDSEDVFSREVLKLNSNSLLEVPNKSQPWRDRLKYLPCLIRQDWSHLFQSYNNSGTDFYVYVHTDPSQRAFVTKEEFGGNYGGTPFYVGKGKGNRAFDLKRNQGHGKRIKKLLEEGYSDLDLVKIVFANLSELKAMEIEAKLIYFFGTVYERDSGSYLFNLDISKRPSFFGEMQRLERKDSSKSEFKKAHEKRN